MEFEEVAYRRIAQETNPTQAGYFISNKQNAVGTQANTTFPALPVLRHKVGNNVPIKSETARSIQAGSYFHQSSQG